MPGWLSNLLPILLLLVAVIIVFYRLPKIEVGHSAEFLRRRVLNWLPLGLTYAFLYMGRYNLEVSKLAFSSLPGSEGQVLMGNADFGFIFGVGTVIYGLSFLINGPLTDRFGGRISILTGALGALIMNTLMGLATLSLVHQGPYSSLIAENFVFVFSVLYGLNMYFQSFGAVAIVKVNAPWFHVKERGVFGAIFGILISLGIYFAFDWNTLILKTLATDTDKHAGLPWVFFAPAILLAIFWVLDLKFVRNTPGDAGQVDFNTTDASSNDKGASSGAITVFKMMLRNPIILTIAAVEFCSGFLRQSIMQWFRTFAKQTDAILHLKDGFVFENWGMLLCIAGILGGVVAGTISDHVFGSRRGPVAVLLYSVLLAGALTLVFVYDMAVVGILVIVMSTAVIGVHGMLSGTAGMDFGGAKNVGIAVGIIDGCVYLGTAAMSFTYAILLPEEQLGITSGPATEPSNWLAWPVAMVPIAAVGLYLATRL
ncbi:MAG: MFS transporter, partial [Bacteroidota bacterium]